MKILILSQEYAPEEISSAILAQELAEDLVHRGHEITVVTRAPNYPIGQIFPGYRNAIYQVENLNGVRVIRVWSHITPRKEFWHRIFSFGTFSATAFYGGLFAGKPDLLVSYLPPLPLGVSAWLLRSIWGVPWLLRLEDLFPEAAIAAGVLNNKKTIKLFDWLASFLYRKADHISLITAGFRRSLYARGIPAEKLSVIPVWADPDIVTPLPKENKFRQQHHLGEKFVIMYAGILGVTSSLEDVMQAALNLKDNPDIQFVIVGEGVKKEWLAEFIQQHDLNNVLLLPFQPRNDFPTMMAAADINLATLNQALSEFSLPHKIFNIMASERAILVVAPPASDLANLVKAGECGVIVPLENPTLLTEVILQLQKDPAALAKMGANGRALLLSTYSRKHCMDQYEKSFNEIAQMKKKKPAEAGNY